MLKYAQSIGKVVDKVTEMLNMDANMDDDDIWN